MATGSARGVHAPDDRDRRFGIAVAASLAAHALILFVLPGLLESSRSRPVPPVPIVARLAEPRPVAEPPPLVEAPVRPRQDANPRPVPKPAPAPSPQPVLSVPAPVMSSPSVQAPVVAPQAADLVQPVAPAPANPSAAAPSAPPAAGEAPDAVTVGQYRIAIITAARRYKRYPRIAMDNNWEGQAEVRMVIGTDGNIASILVRKSSGFEVLDQQALEMIRRAKGQAPVPAALRGKGFTLDVPVVFSLREEGG